MADHIMDGDMDFGFALIRPRAGFRAFNNVAIVAEHLRRVHGLERIFILDFDVHHGSGTQSVFFDGGQVVFKSIPQEDLLFDTGQAGEIGCGKGQGNTINLPTGPQCDDPECMRLWDKALGGAERCARPLRMKEDRPGGAGEGADDVFVTVKST
jgi:acetoin utilization deacetylase AcuC-like enzyme